MRALLRALVAGGGPGRRRLGPRRGAAAAPAGGLLQRLRRRRARGRRRSGSTRSSRQFARETSTQVVVAIFDQLPSPSLEDFTVKTAESWRVGRKDWDNGAVLFVFVEGPASCASRPATGSRVPCPTRSAGASSTSASCRASARATSRAGSRRGSTASWRRPAASTRRRPPRKQGRRPAAGDRDRPRLRRSSCCGSRAQGARHMPVGRTYDRRGPRRDGSYWGGWGGGGWGGGGFSGGRRLVRRGRLLGRRRLVRRRREPRAAGEEAEGADVRHDAFLAAIDDERIVAAIRSAESRSRGEIRVHVAEGLVSDPRRAAEADFARLGMAATAERNGVLILVAPESQSFAVIGDEGIHDEAARRASGTGSPPRCGRTSAPARFTRRDRDASSRASGTSCSDTSRAARGRRTRTSFPTP